MTPRYNESGEFMYMDNCDDTSAMTKADYAEIAAIDNDEFDDFE